MCNTDNTASQPEYSVTFEAILLHESDTFLHQFGYDPVRIAHPFKVQRVFQGTAKDCWKRRAV